MRLDGKVAIVLGAATCRNIGQVIAPSLPDRACRSIPNVH